MVSTSQNNLNNSTSNSEQVTNTVINDLNRKPKPIFGEIINLLYLENSNNLAAVAIQTETGENIIVLAKDRDVSPEESTIKINNLVNFQVRLEEAFNHRSLVSISYEGNRIVAVVRITQEREQEVAPESVEAMASRVDPRRSIFSCCAFPPYCPSGVRICS